MRVSTVLPADVHRAAQGFVTVVVATRDRPALFAVAVESILAQTEQGFDLVVVHDGSAEEHRAAYREQFERLARLLGDRLRVQELQRRPKGHGQSYAFNVGVAMARTEFVGFLDDDDAWIDSGHLARVRGLLALREVDLFLGNQRAWSRDKPVERSLWLGGLEAQLTALGRRPGDQGAYDVGIDDLMAASGFCHLNCLIVRRALYEFVGGMDEGIRWECDRDLFLRLCDHAGRILHHPAVMSRHNVPDPSVTANMTTAVSMLEKRLFQLRVLDKAALFARHPVIRAHGRVHKGYVLKQIAEELASIGRWRDAAWYAMQALGALPTFKWAFFSAHCLIRRIISQEQSRAGRFSPRGNYDRKSK